MLAGAIWLWIGKNDSHIITRSCSMKSKEILDQPSICELLHMNAAEHRYSTAWLLFDRNRNR